MNVLRNARTAVSLGAAAVLLTAGGVVTAVAHGQSASADAFVVAANGGLNVRSGPGLTNSVIGLLPTGSRIDSTGPAQNGWMPISFQGRTGWVSDTYLHGQGAGDAPSEKPPVSQGRAFTTADLNVRSGAGLSYRVITVLPKGSPVETTGVNANGYSQIVHERQARWVSSQYLSGSKPAAAAPAGPGLPAITGTATATSELMIRTSSGDSFDVIRDVPAGTVLQLTGVTENGRTQVVYEGQLRWVNSLYLSGSNTVSRPSGAAGPAPAPNLSDRGGSSGLEGLQPNTKALLGRLQARFPEVTTYYGVRDDPYPDHPSGHAIDAMVYSNSSLGDRIAEYAKSNADALNVDYIIWNQRIWSKARASEGWRTMADRGSDTANHRDHVHITVR